MSHECPDCEIKLRKGVCPQCGWRSAGESAAPAPKTPAVCPADGARLQADGWCQAGQGYQPHMSCPFACPICRGQLGWDGGCETCHGTATGDRYEWTFPGDRYEFEQSHWRRVLTGSRRACTPEENAAQAKALRAILARAPMLAPVKADA